MAVAVAGPAGRAKRHETEGIHADMTRLTGRARLCKDRRHGPRSRGVGFKRPSCPGPLIGRPLDGNGRPVDRRGLAASRRRVSADPLCSCRVRPMRAPDHCGRLRRSFADSNACRRIVGRGLAAAVDLGSRRVGGRMSAAVGRRRRRRAPSWQRACRRRSGSMGSSMQGLAGAFCEPPRMGALKASRVQRQRALPATSEDAPAGAARAGARRRS